MDWSSAATYNIVISPGRDDDMEIRRKGRTTYVCERKKHLVGAPELRLNTPAVDGNASVASAKLKPSHSGCRILLGDASQVSRRDWQSVKVENTQYTQFSFSHNKRKYLWNKLPNEDNKHDLHAAMWLSDLQLVDAHEPGAILARFSKNQSPAAKALLGKFEALTDIGTELELLGLISILGLRECQALGVRASKMPLARGPPILIHGSGVEGVVGCVR
ncbi:hypothetical protein DOTSEDRAFT_52804 [Dothistroma septosporum NZE10]|uniref:Uncharacterized protein n=1 Tax=Dothistroma septosporum (strain NZE10 / CBS 128990) TaxID=675120 RepID=N1PQ94_DOTSN|nr:hypothetical protein DOTSEDRAFT_52804 [Dothistroma septosporum NZE10]